jgi:hypothetical protein
MSRRPGSCGPKRTYFTWRLASTWPHASDRWLLNSCDTTLRPIASTSEATGVK